MSGEASDGNDEEASTAVTCQDADERILRPFLFMLLALTADICCGVSVADRWGCSCRHHRGSPAILCPVAIVRVFVAVGRAGIRVGAADGYIRMRNSRVRHCATRYV